MTKLAHGAILGAKFCEVLGIEPKMVKSITIEAAASNLVLAKIVRYISDDEFGGIIEAVGEYRLTPKTADDE